MVGAVSVLLLAGVVDTGAAHALDGAGPVVAVGAGSSLTVTAPINGSNLDYVAVGQNFAAPGVIAALRDLRGGTIRYPGGAISNYWDWQNGSLNQPALTTGAGKVKPGRVENYGFTLRTLLGIVRETGDTPVFDLNLISSTLSNQLQMLHTAQSLGIPVRYVELGNEFYLNFSTYLKAFPTAGSYARTVATWAPAIRAAFPHAEIAAVGSLPQDTARERSWNHTLLSVAGADINAVTLHDYSGPTVKDPSAAEVLAAAQTNWRTTLSVMAAIPRRYRIWFTEFNLDRQGLLGGNPVRGTTWLHGLYVAESTVLFDQSPHVQLNDYWDLFSSDLATGAFNSGPFPQLTVAGTALMFLTNASVQASRITPLRFTGAPSLPDGATGVIGVSFNGPRGTRTVLINLTDQAVTLSAGTGTGLSPEAPTVSVSAAPTTTVSGLTRTTGVVGRSLTLPAYTITGVGFTIPTAPGT